MKCKRCEFDMTAKVIDVSITIWRCPFDHKYTEVTNRPSAYTPPRQSTYPYNLEQKETML